MLKPNWKCGDKEHNLLGLTVPVEDDRHYPRHRCLTLLAVALKAMQMRNLSVTWSSPSKRQ